MDTKIFTLQHYSLRLNYYLTTSEYKLTYLPYSMRTFKFIYVGCCSIICNLIAIYNFVAQIAENI